MVTLTEVTDNFTMLSVVQPVVKPKIPKSSVQDVLAQTGLPTMLASVPDQTVTKKNRSRLPGSAMGEGGLFTGHSSKG